MDIRLHRPLIQSGVPTPHKWDGRQVNGFPVGLNSSPYFEKGGWCSWGERITKIYLAIFSPQNLQSAQLSLPGTPIAAASRRQNVVLSFQKFDFSLEREFETQAVSATNDKNFEK